MMRWFKIFLPVGTLALATVLMGQFDQSAQASQMVTINYNGLIWTATTDAKDVAEVLLENFEAYDTFIVEPSPATSLSELMTIKIQDASRTKLDRVVATNYQTKQDAKTTPTTPIAKPKPKPKPSEIQSGLATWYRFGDKLTAASRKYPKGTKLRVVAVNSGKSVDVVINDYGPSALTGIDLDLNAPAFEKLAPLGAGKIRIKYYRL